MQDIDGSTYGDKVDSQYPPMPVANPVPRDEPQTELSIDSAAAEVTERRQQQLEREGRPLDEVRTYRQQAGPDAGKPVDERQTVSAEQAAYDLAGARQGEADQIAAAENQALKEAMDRLLNGQQQPVEAQPQQQEVPVEQPLEQPQAQQPQADDEVVRALQSNPKLLAALNQQMEAAFAQSSQMAQQYAQSIQANANMALQTLISHWPELKGVRTPEQLQTALQAIKYQNPIRHSEVVDHIQQVSRLVGEAQRVEHARQQAYQQQLQQFQKASDDAFEIYRVEQGISDEQLGEITKTAHAILRETAGMTDAQIAHQWHTNPQFRSVGFQKILLQASQWRLAQKGAASKRSVPVPQVQRPGAAPDRASRDDYFLKSLEDKFRATGSAKDAAALVTARRTRRS
jgi:hypothetical protein